MKDITLDVRSAVKIEVLEFWRGKYHLRYNFTNDVVLFGKIQVMMKHLVTNPPIYVLYHT